MDRLSDSEMSYGCEASSPARTGGQLFLSTHLLALCSQDKNTVLGLTGGAAQSLSSPSSFPDRILELQWFLRPHLNPSEGLETNTKENWIHALSLFIFFFFKFYFIFKLYITVLDLPNIKMNPPQVYMCSPS